MVDLKRVLPILSRVIPAIVFVDLIKTALIEIPEVLHRVITAPAIGDFRLFLLTATGFSAVLTVITGSPAAYSVTLALLLVVRIPVASGDQSTIPTIGAIGGELPTPPSSSSIEIPWVGIAGLFLVLLLDAYLTAYRTGGIGIAKYGSRGVAVSVATFLALSAPFIVASAILGTYFSVLMRFFKSFSETLEASPLRAILSSFITYTIVAVVAVYALVKLLNSVAEVITPLVVPSKNLSLKALLEVEDLNKAFTPPFLGTVLGLAIIAFYPVVHAMLFKILLELPGELHGGLGTAVSVLTHAASIAVTSYIVFGSTSKGILIHSHRRGILPLVLVLLLVYASAVKVSLWRGYGLVHSLIYPDIAGVFEILGTSYTSYAYFVVTFSESLLKFLGVAP